jgi:hypothetical protein
MLCRRGACIWTQLETATLEKNSHPLFFIHIMLLICSLGIDLGHFAFWHRNRTSWLTLLHGDLPWSFIHCIFLIRYIFLIRFYSFILPSPPLPSPPLPVPFDTETPCDPPGNLHMKCFWKCTRACLFHDPLSHYYKTSATWRPSIKIEFMSGGGKVTTSPTKYFQKPLWGSELAPRVDWKSSSSFYVIFKLFFTMFNRIVVYVCP